MIHLAFALIVMSVLAAATFLAISGYPWLAALVIVCGTSISMRESDGKEKDKDENP